MSDTVPTLERLPPNALTLFRLSGLIRIAVYGVLGSFAAFILSRTGLGGWAWLFPGAAVLVCGVLAAWYPPRAHQRWGWALREHDLLIAHGVLVRRLVSIPAGRIQHVDVHQGPIERALGLARLQVYTASGGGADGEIPGLARETADALREKLVRREADDVV
ncbi:PH domain-containing protein [Myxococcus sp. RHSTA-1-4]|uniref:PH domain-containing protein n=1 Tax=Myxococcus sp. RHSTA-1-4 TaxID=2874601 RepID=UPI001CC02BFC|nr:PH domain-containing protein [Myxococcus sp. RHSTA-1-4]MBZ4422892.1 PH domain-containing protein [Myxococcus sp. RHSTA-1-4]